MNETTLREAFGNLNIWRAGDQRAPHKPLLILYTIARYLDGHDRLMAYQELEKPLKQLIKEFGPGRASYHPEFPFWHLQTDGVWELTDRDKIHGTAGRPFSIREFRDLNIQGGFPFEIEQTIKDNPAAAAALATDLLNAHFPESYHEDILNAISFPDMTVQPAQPAAPGRRPRDPKFRMKILRAYEFQCAVCGMKLMMDTVPVALEAAHIKWHQAHGPDSEENGIALCSLHHKLFDRGAFTLDPEMTILVSDRLHGNEQCQQLVVRFHGGKMGLPQRDAYKPQEEYTAWHVSEVFQGLARE